MKNKKTKIIAQCIISGIKSTIIQFSGTMSVFTAGLLAMAAYFNNENESIPLTIIIVCISLLIAGVAAMFYNDHKFFGDMMAVFDDREKKVQKLLNETQEIQDAVFKIAKAFKGYSNNVKKDKISNEEGGM